MVRGARGSNDQLCCHYCVGLKTQRGVGSNFNCLLVQGDCGNGPPGDLERRQSFPRRGFSYCFPRAGLAAVGRGGLAPKGQGPCLSSMINRNRHMRGPYIGDFPKACCKRRGCFPRACCI